MVKKIKDEQRTKTVHTHNVLVFFHNTIKTSTSITHSLEAKNEGEIYGGSHHAMSQALGFHLPHNEMGRFKVLATQFSNTAHVADAKHSFKYVYYFPHNNPVR